MADVSLAAMGLRLAISMGVVLGLMVLAAKLLRRAQAAAVSGATRGRRRAKVVTIPLAVTTVAPLARGASVALVRAAGRDLVVGVTEQQVTLLHSAPVPTAADDAVDLDAELRELTSAPTATTPTSPTTPTASTARIAVDAAGTPDRGPGMPAWTDALETLRAMTVRR